MKKEYVSPKMQVLSVLADKIMSASEEAHDIEIGFKQLWSF